MVAIWTAVIWLSVRVPVLSELSADVEPSVSTDRRRFMMAPASASNWDPLDRMAVTTAGRAVGMAATANATALRNSSSSWTLRYRPSPMDTTSAMPAMTRIWLVRASSCFVSGVFSMVGGLEHAADMTDLGRHARS